MLREKLLTYKADCENKIKSSQTLLSIFSPRFNYTIKLCAINKLILDMNDVDVQYTESEIEVLRRGKLGAIIDKHPSELPIRFKYDTRITKFEI